MYLAAREAAHQRLFAHVGWLRSGCSARSRSTRGASPSTPRGSRSWPAASTRRTRRRSRRPCARACSSSRPRRRRRRRCAAGDAARADRGLGGRRRRGRRRRPAARAPRRCARRCGAGAPSGGPAEQTFATIVGLELRPRRLRNAAELWRLLGEQRGTAGRDALWAHPDLIPSADDLDDPAAFVAREELGDPIAELETAMRAEEQAERTGRQDRRRRSRRRSRRPTALTSGGSAGPIRSEASLGCSAIVAVGADEAQPGGGGQPLEVAHRPLGARVAAHPAPRTPCRGRARAGAPARGRARSRRPSPGRRAGAR